MLVLTLKILPHLTLVLKDASTALLDPKDPLGLLAGQALVVLLELRVWTAIQVDLDTQAPLEIKDLLAHLAPLACLDLPEKKVSNAFL